MQVTNRTAKAVAAPSVRSRRGRVELTLAIVSVAAGADSHAAVLGIAIAAAAIDREVQGFGRGTKSVGAQE